MANNKGKESVVHGTFHAVIQDEGGKEDWRFVDIAKKEMDRVAERREKILFLELAPSSLTFIQEMQKILHNWKYETRKYRPPEELPSKFKEALLKVHRKLKKHGLQMSEQAVLETVNKSLGETHLFLFHVVNYAKEKEFQIYPLVRQELLEEAGKWQERYDELRKRGENDKAIEALRRFDIAVVDMEYCIYHDAGKLVEKGIVPDITLVGDRHSKSMTKKLGDMGINAKRRDPPDSMIFSKRDMEYVNARDRMLTGARGTYARLRRKLTQRIKRAAESNPKVVEDALIAFKEKKAQEQAQKTRQRTTERRRRG